MHSRQFHAGLAVFVAVAAVVVLAAGEAAAFTQWSCNGVPLSSSSGDQSSASAASDSSGGAIIVWADSRSGNQDIYAQRVNGNGVLQWAAGGVAVCTAANAQTSAAMVSDGNHGAFVVWNDSRAPSNPNLYVQRITASGTVASGWPTDGVCVCPSAVYPTDPYIAADGLGGVIAVWEDYRTNGIADIYAQRISADATCLWTSTGILVCDALNNQTLPVCVADGSGGALFAWQDPRASISDIYLQHVSANGGSLWTANGVAANLTVGLRDAEYPTLASDGSGGAIVAWQDKRNGTDYDVYGLRFTAAGSAAGSGSWITGGVPICTAGGDQKGPLSVSDGVGGMVVVWSDFRNGAASDLYAQRMTGAGDVAPAWPANGTAVCTAAGNQTSPSIVTDGSAGAIMTWYDYRNGFRTKVFSQRLTSTGSVAPGWTANGVAVCASDSVQQLPTAVPDGSSGAIVAWQDNRTNTYKVYATRIIAGGGVLDVPAPPSTAFRIHEPRPNPSSGMAAFAFELPAERAVEACVFDLAGRVVRTLEPGRSFPAGAHQLAWDGRDDGGNPVAAGVYLVRMKAGSDVQVRRMVRLR